MPTFPSIDPSNLDLSRLDFSRVDVDRILELARDAAYVGVGLTVLAVQRAQVARRDAAKAIERQARRMRDLIPV